MTRRPLFHPVTATELEMYGRRLPQSVLLYGHEGIGLETAATWLAGQAGASILTILPEYNDKVDLEKGRITIGVIRRLYDLTRSKNIQRQCVIITAADTITIEAQQAFLKLLEEPSEATTFILLCHEPQKLLPTILSRVQQLQIRRIDRVQSEALLTSLGVTDATTRAQLLFIAEGLPGLLTRLATTPKLLEAEAAYMRQARAIVQGASYERLIEVQKVKDDRAGAGKLVAYMVRLLRREISHKGVADGATVDFLEHLEHAQAGLEANGNVRLVLAAAVL